MRLFQISKKVIRIIFDELVVHEFRFSLDKNRSVCYAILEDPAKTINFLESLKFKIEKPFKSYVLAPVLFLIDIWYRSFFPSIRYSYR